MSVLERSPSYKESNKGNKQRQEPTQSDRFTEVSVKRESTVVASVVVVGADADIGDSTVDNVAAVVAIVVISVVVAGIDDDLVDSVLDDVGPDVVVVGASVVLRGEDNDVVALVGTVVVYDVDGGVVSGVVDVTVVDIVELFKFPIVQSSVNSQHEKEVSSVFRLFN